MSRILHALCLDKVGGVEAVFDAYLGHALARRHEHHVLLLNGPAHPHYQPNLSSHAASTRSARHWRGHALPNFARPSFARRYAASVDPDIVVIYSTLLRRAAWQLRALPRARLVYYERGAAWMRDEPLAAIRRNLACTDRILCNSRAAARMLALKFDVPAERCRVIYNPLRLSAAPAPSAPSAGPLRLGMAGRIVPVKGMVSAVHAVRSLLDRGIPVELVIAGAGPEETALREAARRLRLGNAVRFAGVVKDMTAFYAGIDVFLCPSLREPLGNVAIEAGAAGRPVICTAVDGLPEVVTDGVTGLCLEPTLSGQDYFELGVARHELPSVVYDPVTDALRPARALAPAAIATAVEVMHADPARRLAMGTAAIERARARFGMDRYMAELDADLVSA